VIALAGCRQDMHDQPRFEPLEGSAFFADGRSARPLVAGTVARGHLELDPHLETGKLNGELARSFPFAITRERLERGRERYGIFCAPCHDGLGTGQGLVVRRGMKAPVSFHVERLRQAPAGYFFDVVTNGFGAMFDFSDRIEASERWEIVAYVRALQRSQDARLEDVPHEERASLAEAR